MIRQPTKKECDRLPCFPWRTLRSDDKACCTRCGGTAFHPLTFHDRQANLCHRCGEEFAEIANAWMMRRDVIAGPTGGLRVLSMNGERSPEELAEELEPKPEPAPAMLF